MLKYLSIPLVAFAIATGGLSAAPAHAQSTESVKEASKKSKAPIGIYDPQKKAKRVKGMSIEHVFIAWQQFDAGDLQQRARYAKKLRRKMMITVEPWTHAPNWTDGGETLFADIVDGDYDEQITTVCTEVSKIRRRPLVRWGHEMEEVTGRYPWARHDSSGYITAYRYFVQSCRTIAPKAKFVWSPIGHDGLSDYYPGKEYVDLVGFPVWGYQKADRKWYGHDRSFEEAAREKYSRLTHFKKPIIIAELGVSGSKKYESRWIKRLKSAAQIFPKLKAVVYFNMLEPASWPDGLGKPDWRINPKKLK